MKKPLLQIKYVICTILIIYFSLTVTNRLSGQEKINITAGFGLPELINGGVRFQLNQVQLGISLGFIPDDYEDIISVAGDIYFHLTGSSKYSSRYQYYFRLGCDYFRLESEYDLDEYVYLNLRFGKDFDLSKKFGINVDGGIAIELDHKETAKKQQYSFWPDTDTNYGVFPSLGISLFYRI